MRERGGGGSKEEKWGKLPNYTRCRVMHTHVCDPLTEWPVRASGIARHKLLKAPLSSVYDCC